MFKKIRKVRNGKFLEDFVAEESALLLKINGTEENMVMSPGHVRELCFGYLLSEGYIGGIKDVISYRTGKGSATVKVKPKKITVKLSTSPVQEKVLEKIRSAVSENGVVYKKTGATHSAGIFDFNGNCVVFREDINRHCAVDKVIGYCLLNGINLCDKILYTSGRVPESQAMKAVRCGIPAIVTLSFPLSGGLKTAKKEGMTLISLKGGDYSLYNGKVVP